MIKKLFYISILLVLTLLWGCVSDSVDNMQSGKGEIVRVAFSLAAKTCGNASSRADGVPENPSDNEKINDWWIVFAHRNKEGNFVVYKIIDREDANPGLGGNSSMLPVEEEQFETDLPSGNYRVYAFANLSRDLLKQHAGIEFRRGEPVGDVMNALWRDISDGNNLNLWNTDVNIPMAGYIDNIHVQNTVEETFSIEVVRLVAKIEMKFTNKTDKDITINSVSLDSVTISPVKLMPDYNCLGNYSYTPVDNPVPVYDRLTYSLDPLECVLEKLDVGKNVFFYCKESKSNHPAKKFTVGVNITRRNSEGVVSNHELHYSPTDLIEDYINRNDWIRIPISFTDWIVDFDVIFYPPIGGYPAVARWNDTNSDAHYFTFGTQGTFVIIPKIREAKDGSDYLLPDNYLDKNAEGYLESDSKLKIDVAGDSIFASLPTVDNTTGEIIGILNNNKGMATVTVSYNLEGLLVKRKLYIIRDNI